MLDSSRTASFSVVTFNVNGLRPCLRRFGFTSERYLSDFLDHLLPHASVVCIQEVKMASRELNHDFCRPPEWEMYYGLSRISSLPPLLRSSVVKISSVPNVGGGYAGVLTCCRTSEAAPFDAREGLLWVLHRLDNRYKGGSSSGDIVSPNAFTATSDDRCIRKTLALTYCRFPEGCAENTLPEALPAENVADALRELYPWAERLDQEGRCVITHHGSFVLINVYAPALRVIDVSNEVTTDSHWDSHRLALKSVFHCLLHLAVLDIKAHASATALPSVTSFDDDAAPSSISVIVAGDFNVQLRLEDGVVPASVFAWKAKTLPFINQTSWMMESCNLVDAFRHQNRTVCGIFTCWPQVTGGRITNQGARIDLILVDRALVASNVVHTMDDIQTSTAAAPRPASFNSANSSMTLQQVVCHIDVHGSDHCPVSAVFTGTSENSVSCLVPLRTTPEAPPLCASWLPQATLQQLTLVELFSSQGSEAAERPVMAYRCCLLLGPPEERQRDFLTSSDTVTVPSHLRVYLSFKASSAHHYGHHGFCLIHVFLNHDPPTLVLSSASVRSIGLVSKRQSLGTHPLHCCLPFYLFHAGQRNVTHLQHVRSPRALLMASEAKRRLPPSHRDLELQDCAISELAAHLYRILSASSASWATGFHLCPDYVDKLLQHPDIIQLPDSVAFSKLIDAERAPVVLQYTLLERTTTATEPCSTETPAQVSQQSQKMLRDKRTLQSKVSFLGDKEQNAYFSTIDFAPLCIVHKIPCVKRKVKKPGKNQGREFWSCVLPVGQRGDIRGRCQTFIWSSLVPKPSKKWL